jgi:uncharacterized protein
VIFPIEWQCHDILVQKSKSVQSNVEPLLRSCLHAAADRVLLAELQFAELYAVCGVTMVLMDTSTADRLYENDSDDEERSQVERPSTLKEIRKCIKIFHRDSMAQKLRSVALAPIVDYFICTVAMDRYPTDTTHDVSADIMKKTMHSTISENEFLVFFRRCFQSLFSESYRARAGGEFQMNAVAANSIIHSLNGKQTHHGKQYSNSDAASADASGSRIDMKQQANSITESNRMSSSEHESDFDELGWKQSGTDKLQWLMQHAKRGSSRSKYLIALCYSGDEPYFNDPVIDSARWSIFVKWLSEAAEEGYVPAQYRLGLLYAEMDIQVFAAASQLEIKSSALGSGSARSDSGVVSHGTVPNMSSESPSIAAANALQQGHGLSPNPFQPHSHGSGPLLDSDSTTTIEAQRKAKCSALAEKWLSSAAKNGDDYHASLLLVWVLMLRVSDIKKQAAELNKATLPASDTTETAAALHLSNLTLDSDLAADSQTKYESNTAATNATVARSISATARCAMKWLKHAHAIKLKHAVSLSNLVQAAQYGNASAQCELGLMFLLGRAYRPPELQLAARWLQRAALQGNAQALYATGIIYHTGVGVPEDSEMSRLCWSKAITLGYAPAVGSFDRAFGGVPNSDVNKTNFQQTDEMIRTKLTHQLRIADAVNDADASELECADLPHDMQPSVLNPRKLKLSNQTQTHGDEEDARGICSTGTCIIS